MVNGLMTDDFGGIYTRAYDLETYTCTFFDRSLVFIWRETGWIGIRIKFKIWWNQLITSTPTEKKNSISILVLFWKERSEKKQKKERESKWIGIREGLTWLETKACKGPTSTKKPILFTCPTIPSTTSPLKGFKTIACVCQKNNKRLGRRNTMRGSFFFFLAESYHSLENLTVYFNTNSAIPVPGWIVPAEIVRILRTAII